MHIPEETVAKWPKPNYVNPETRVGVMVGLEAPLAVLMTVALVARFYSRGIMRRILGWDDWTMLVAWSCTLACSILSWLTIQYGIAHHVWDAKKEWDEPRYRTIMAVEANFAVAFAFTKISICITYLRLFPGCTNVYFCRTSIAYHICYCITFVFVTLFQCSPMEDYWKPDKPDRRCISQKYILVAGAVLNSLSDLVVFLWPARFLWGVKLPRERRLGLMALFCAGCLVSVCGVVRIWYITVYFHDPLQDITMDGTHAWIILAFESNLGVVCGCLPGCKPVFVKLFPGFFSRSSSSRAPEPEQCPLNGMGDFQRPRLDPRLCKQSGTTQGTFTGSGSVSASIAGEAPMPTKPPLMYVKPDPVTDTSTEERLRAASRLQKK